MSSPLSLIFYIQSERHENEEHDRIVPFKMTGPPARTNINFYYGGFAGFTVDEKKMTTT